MRIRRKPLRLIAARTWIIDPEKTIGTQIYLETLECRHQLTVFSDFRCDEKGHIVNEPPKAKRRRCQECRRSADDARVFSSLIPIAKKEGDLTGHPGYGARRVSR
jgi:hypothetical protein